MQEVFVLPPRVLPCVLNDAPEKGFTGLFNKFFCLAYYDVPNYFFFTAICNSTYSALNLRIPYPLALKTHLLVACTFNLDMQKKKIKRVRFFHLKSLDGSSHNAHHLLQSNKSYARVKALT